MNDLNNKTYWLIGASEGLGRELAKRLDRDGATLILSARNADRLNSLAAELRNARSLPLDVTDNVAVTQAGKDVGAIDGVIYNVGTYEPMRTTKWDTRAILKMVDVNFAGAIRALGCVIPQFTKNGKGDITLIGSLAGYHGLPASIGYGASKSAMISLAETMRHDLKNTGIVVRVVNPGFIKTRLTKKNEFKMPMLMSAEQAALHVHKAMKSNRFRTDFPAPFSWLIRLLPYLPDILIYRGK
ncbi:short-chain dehydrogenase [Amylibacter kogurei]|uniref:Short-chain dehydrogenase n=1 Tax=Paramylibacter kogurei TaxID=1889778 RepID=A0A2G5K7V0_9RHOB|nr:SDR family NAD(P)-dependent oxidoreductase [Amylibacter kogurei]PIB25611.1 short-chain dehydrogenase [Amylibacter kogurei]